MTNTQKRQKDEREMANSCIGILADLLAHQMGIESNPRKDKQPYIEFIHMNPVTGKKRTFMRVDVIVRIFEEGS